MTENHAKVRNITKGLRTMKFMARKRQITKQELEKEQRDQEVEDQSRTKMLASRANEFWEIDLPFDIKPIYLKDLNSNLSITQCYELGDTRQSYGGFNPEIEKEMNRGKQIDESNMHLDMVDGISDEQMAEYMKSKRINFKEEALSEGEIEEPPAKRNRFEKPDTSDLS